jgi:hypothetical protein
LAATFPAKLCTRAEAGPEESAHIVIGNDDPSNPVIIRWQPPNIRRLE